MFNDTNTVTSTSHITFSTRKFFLQMHLTNLNTALQRLILGHLFSFSDKTSVFCHNYMYMYIYIYVWISKYGIKEIFIDRR